MIFQSRLTRRVTYQLYRNHAAWTAALVFAVVSRYEFALRRVGWARLITILPIVLLAQIVSGLAAGLYVGRWRYGSFEEVAALAQAVGVTSVFALLVDAIPVGPRMVPFSAPLIGGFIALVLMAAIRYSRRLDMERRRRPSDGAAERIVVFGAGEGGAQVVTAMLGDRNSPYLPVALVDDDPAKRNLRIRGVPVVGTRDHLAAVVAAYEAKAVLIAMAEQAGGVYLSVRFGNVLCSRGSVLTSFQAQIEAGGPLTVTHPDVVRYFMTVEEAVELVIQAGAIGRGGEALVFDMGEPVRINDVAQFLITRSGRPIDIVYTGLRPGEKLHEALLGRRETDHRPFHPLISHVVVPGLDPRLLDTLDPAAAPYEIVAKLSRITEAVVRE